MYDKLFKYGTKSKNSLTIIVNRMGIVYYVGMCKRPHIFMELSSIVRIILEATPVSWDLYPAIHWIYHIPKTQPVWTVSGGEIARK